MKRSGIIILLVTFILGVVLFSCRKLPPLPDNYETLFAEPGNLEKVTVPCESELEDNVFFTDIYLNGSDTFYAYDVSNLDNYSYTKIVAEDYYAGVTVTVSFSWEFEYLYCIGKFLAGPSYISESQPASVELSSTESYYTDTYVMKENCYIYVENTKSQIIISLCGIELVPRYGAQNTDITLSGRIIYNK